MGTSYSQNCMTSMKFGTRCFDIRTLCAGEMLHNFVVHGPVKEQRIVQNETDKLKKSFDTMAWLRPGPLLLTWFNLNPSMDK